jgi:hypothetical protein
MHPDSFAPLLVRARSARLSALLVGLVVALSGLRAEAWPGRAKAKPSGKKGRIGQILTRIGRPTRQGQTSSAVPLKGKGGERDHGNANPTGRRSVGMGRIAWRTGRAARRGRISSAAPQNPRTFLSKPTFFREIGAHATLPPELVRAANRMAKGIRSELSLLDLSTDHASPEDRLEAERRMKGFTFLGPSGMPLGPGHRLGPLPRWRFARQRFGLDAAQLRRELTRIGTEALGHPVRVTKFEIALGLKEEGSHRDTKSRDASLVIPLDGATGTHYFPHGANGPRIQARGASIHGLGILHAHGEGPRIRAMFKLVDPSSSEGRHAENLVRRARAAQGGAGRKALSRR